MNEYDADRDLLARVLEPYRPDCRYLRSAHLSDIAEDVAAWGRFEISASGCVEGPTLFGAVELALCFDQLGHYLLAKCLSDKLFPRLTDASLADFWNGASPDAYITQSSCRFDRAPADLRSVTGEIVFRTPVVVRRGGSPSVLLMDASSYFEGADGGSAEADFTLTFPKLP